MNNRSAAGLRRSAIVARIRLREEWSELKGTEESTKSINQVPEIIRKNQKPVRSASKLVAQKVKYTKNKTKSPSGMLKKTNRNILANVPVSQRNMETEVDALRGVVALVDVGAETRALALRAALMALGATVVPAWSPFVTHLVWTQGGCRDTRAKARALACRLVSPLWVEACASCGRRVTEAAFPAAARPSDLPSPRALRIMLKRAEAENIPLSDLLNNHNNADDMKVQRLRISSETEHDTSADQTDTSHDRTTDQDTSHDRSGDSTDPGIRVNTLPRGGRAATPPQHPKSRRKLFTHREAENLTDKDEEETPAVPKRTASKLTQRERKDLARAERMARRMLGAATPAHALHLLSNTEAPRIVLTGMSRIERQSIQAAIKILNGRVQKQVNHRTTHVVLGSCTSSENRNDLDNTGIQPFNESHCSKISSTNTRLKTPSINTRSEIPSTNTRCEIPSTNTRSEIPNINTQLPKCGDKARTLNALLGAARGCRVLYAQWVADSLEVKKWLHHYGYEVPHLRKISQKARVERNALGRTCLDYAYDVFKGMRVRVSHNADQRDAAIQLLTLCGGVVQNGGPSQDGGRLNNAGRSQDGGRFNNAGRSQDGGCVNNAGRSQDGGRVNNGGRSQDGGPRPADCDVCVGNGEGEVSSKWVFDSVAAGRMRTTRRYVNLSVENSR